MRTILIVVPLLLAALLWGTALPASAHENRDVGALRLTAGFNVEPAVERQMNGAQLRVRRVADLSPVTGLADKIKVEVNYSGRTKQMDMRAVFGQDGLYVADFLPTASGRYVFRFFGDVDGVNINETFTSGPGRFNDVQPVADLAFPDAVPDPGRAQEIASDASDSAASARMLAMVGTGVGLLGLVAGGAGVALAARRRP